MERTVSRRAKAVLYAMIAFQLVGWAWFSSQGGILPDKEFLVFSVMMLSGQLAAGIETFVMKAWGTCAIQVWFFGFTTWGAIVRLLQM